MLKQFIINVIVKIDNPDLITININPGALATIAYVDEKKADYTSSAVLNLTDEDSFLTAKSLNYLPLVRPWKTGITYKKNDLVISPISGNIIKCVATTTDPTDTTPQMGVDWRSHGNGENVLDYGAVGDGVADDSDSYSGAAIAAAGGRVSLSSGTSLVNEVQLYGTSLAGAGTSTTVKANNITEIFKLGYTNSPGQWSKRSLNDITIDGNNKSSDGVKFHSASDTEVSGRWAIEKVTFKDCNRGIYKPTGNIGNAYRDVNFTGNSYGFYAVGQASPIMHAGCDVFDNCQFDGSSLAAIYIDSAMPGTGGTQITGDTIIQYNPGFGIFVKNYTTAYTPLVMDGVWFEGNATAASVVINGTSYTPVDIYLEDTIQAELQNGIVPKVQLVNSSLVIDSCCFSADITQLSIDSSSVCYATNAYVDGGIYPIQIKSISQIHRILGNFSLRCYAPPRSIKSHSQTNLLQSITYANADTYSFTGTGTVNAITQADGQIFDSCAELVIPASFTLLQPSATITAGKWYLFTIDLKYIAGTLSDLSIVISDIITFTGGIDSLLVAGEWKTISSMGQAGSSGTVRLYLINGAVGTQTLRLSAMQILEFDTQQEMLSYYNSGIYTMPNSLPRLTYSTVAPTTGTWSVGDRVLNPVSVVGQPKSWVCTVAGNPGTWVSEGNL